LQAFSIKTKEIAEIRGGKNEIYIRETEKFAKFASS
jgi:hypothetical protein